MTAPDVRSAAQAEAEHHILVSSPDALRVISEKMTAAELLVAMYAEGAVWGAALVTPTREQIAEAIAWSADPEYGIVDDVDLAAADAVLALMQGARGNGELAALGGEPRSKNRAALPIE